MKKFEMFDLKNVPLCVDVVCNRCGESCANHFGFVHAAVKVTWGYESDNDGVSHTWDLCEKCHTEVTASFKIKPATVMAGWASAIDEQSDDDRTDLQLHLNHQLPAYPDKYSPGGFSPKEVATITVTEVTPSKSSSS